ncbi:unnamed protein product [Didymodactylos carnosus]|uniref:Uncharacterized protein n=1 Tax=Didymodactylos carnosus TaxID=1234261 RepID=A0A815NLR4_9BILA|nr:unnamed protein product [Didymodactylos carnosus]CAF4316455.1 unnamed protein product [Didymodactylos carnosus]
MVVCLTFTALVCGRKVQYSDTPTLSRTRQATDMINDDNNVDQLYERQYNSNSEDGDKNDKRQYSKLLKLLQKRIMNERHLDESEPSSHTMNKRLFFFSPARSVTLERNPRPEYKYGRKAHWDTFFG